MNPHEALPSLDFKSSAPANYATPANYITVMIFIIKKSHRKFPVGYNLADRAGFEPAGRTNDRLLSKQLV